MTKPKFCWAAVLFLTGCRGGANHMGNMPAASKPLPRTPPAVPTTISDASLNKARAVIESAHRSGNEVVRANAIEVLQTSGMPGADGMIVDALGDRSVLVRKAAAMAVGVLKIPAGLGKMQPLLDAPAAVETADSTPAQQTRMAAIFALHRLGNTAYSHEFEKTATDNRTPVREDTALMLGLLGEPSATPILLQMLRTDRDPNVRLQAAEALWRLGNEHGEDTLIEATVSRYASDQIIAARALAEPRDNRVLGNIIGIMDGDYPEVSLSCARAAGMLGDDTGYGLAMKYADSRDPRQRCLSALAFGSIGRADAKKYLEPMLDDDNDETRLAAAGALWGIATGNKHGG